MSHSIKCLGSISNENIIESNKVDVNGVAIHPEYTNSTTVDNTILYPPAPDGTKTYDSATGAVTTHATSNEAFEGLVTNGDFRNGTTGWTATGGTNISVSGGVLTVENATATSGGVQQTGIAGTNGVTSVLKFSLEKIQPGSTGINIYANNIQIGNIPSVTGLNKYSFEFPSVGTDAILIRYAGGGQTATDSFTLSSVSVMPATEQVITSRQDYVFLESFHEKISDKDVVYPLGNVQYGASSWEGITLSNSLVAQGYSAFGEWDTATTGYGVKWSTLSDADKTKFLQDPDNNIYLDDGELIQVRYRVRVVEGLGDDWLTTTTQESGGFNTLRYSVSSIVRVQGEQVTPFSYTGSNNDGVYGQSKRLPQLGGVDGTFYGQRNSGIGAVLAHNGLCFAIPIALVQRMNQGAYHPVYNPEGCSFLNDLTNTGNWKSWYSSDAAIVNNTSDVFANTHYGLGFIGSPASGRTASDPYQFYDAIYAGQVHDLRKDSNKKTPEELLSEFSKKAFVGEIRGKGSVPFTTIDLAWTPTASGLGYDGAKDVTYINMVGGDLPVQGSSSGSSPAIDGWFILGASGAIYPIVYTSIIELYIRGDFTFDFSIGTPATLVKASWLTSEYETLPWQDIVGDPVNIEATFPSGVYGQWIPDVPDNIKATFAANRKGIETTGLHWVHTENNGATWISASTGSLDPVTNRLNMAGLGQSNAVTLYPYQAKASPYELASKREVIGEIGTAFASNVHSEDYGAALNNALLGKVLNGDWVSAVIQQGYHLDGYLSDSFGLIIGQAPYYPTHNTIPLSMPSNGGASCKAFPYITQESSQYYLQWVYKEMVWDVSFGDNNKFTIIDGESTETDDNGNAIIIGQKRVALPNFTGKSE